MSLLTRQRRFASAGRRPTALAGRWPALALGRLGLRLSQAMAAMLGLALAVLVGADGSLLWQVVRVLCVAVVVGGAALLLPRLGVGGRGTVTLLLGTAGTIIGGALGPRYLAKAGLTLPTVASLAALVAGLVLLAIAAATLLPAARGGRKLLALPVALVVLAVGYVAVPALIATNVPPTSLGSLTPADRGMTYWDVTVRTSDGVALSAWYVPSRNRAAVVLLHGAGATRSETLPHAGVLARHGYGVLRLGPVLWIFAKP